MKVSVVIKKMLVMYFVNMQIYHLNTSSHIHDAKTTATGCDFLNFLTTNHATPGTSKTTFFIQIIKKMIRIIL